MKAKEVHITSFLVKLYCISCKSYNIHVTILTQVQVIPWILEDSNYVKSSSQKLDPHKTVFVGALHGMLTAAGLAKIMDDLFRGVIYAGKNRHTSIIRCILVRLKFNFRD